MRRVKLVALTVAALAVSLVAIGAILYATNTASAPVLPADESARAGRPYVVKIHAQWCPKCMMTKGVWSELLEAYGDRVNFVVFDFTDQDSVDATAREVRRLGLEDYFQWAGGTGRVAVLDGRTKQVIAEIDASRDLADYATAIDRALRLSGGR